MKIKYHEDGKPYVWPLSRFDDRCWFFRPTLSGDPLIPCGGFVTAWKYPTACLLSGLIVTLVSRLSLSLYFLSVVLITPKASELLLSAIQRYFLSLWEITAAKLLYYDANPILDDEDHLDGNPFVVTVNQKSSRTIHPLKKRNRK